MVTSVRAAEASVSTRSTSSLRVPATAMGRAVKLLLVRAARFSMPRVGTGAPATESMAIGCHWGCRAARSCRLNSHATRRAMPADGRETSRWSEESGAIDDRKVDGGFLFSVSLCGTSVGRRPNVEVHGRRCADTFTAEANEKCGARPGSPSVHWNT